MYPYLGTMLSLFLAWVLVAPSSWYVYLVINSSFALTSAICLDKLMSTRDFVLCDDNASLQNALSLLQSEVSRTLILDYEGPGRNLGETRGALSIITLRTTSPAPTYSTSSTPSASLYRNLESSDVTKTMFEGRMD